MRYINAIFHFTFPTTKSFSIFILLLGLFVSITHFFQDTYLYNVQRVNSNGAFRIRTTHRWHHNLSYKASDGQVSNVSNINTTPNMELVFCKQEIIKLPKQLLVQFCKYNYMMAVQPVCLLCFYWYCYHARLFPANFVSLLKPSF